MVGFRALLLAAVLVLLLLPAALEAQRAGRSGAVIDRLELLPRAPPEAGPPLRVARFIHSTDVHILDDDAPYPIRQENLDRLGPPFDAAQRPQEEYTDEAFNSIIPMFNALHLSDPVDFVIFTGDNIDNTLENEVVRFKDNLEGTYTNRGPISKLPYKPDGQSANPDDTSNDVTDAATSLPEVFKQPGYNVPLERSLPWYVVFGNHDGLIQGNAPIEPSFQEVAREHGRYFVNQQEYISLFFDDPGLHGAAQLREFCKRTPTMRGDDGHGFGGAGARLCDSDPDNDGYYTFENGPFLHVVLDTMNDDFVQANGNFGPYYTPGTAAGAYAGGYAEGILDPAQFQWLKAVLSGNTTRPVILHSHHTVNSFVPLPEGPAKQAGYVSGPELTAELNRHPNVLFYVGGHTHKNLMEPKGTFWNVETASLIDPPHENRLIEIYVAPNKTGFLQSYLVPIRFQKTFDLSKSDPQEAGDPHGRKGRSLDREARLWFPIPDAVFEPLRARLDRTVLTQLSASEGIVPAGTVVEFRFQIAGRFSGLPPSGVNYTLELDEETPTGLEVTRLPLEVVEGRATFEVNLTRPGETLVRVHYSGDSVDPGSIVAAVFVTGADADGETSKPRRTPLMEWAALAALAAACWIVRLRRQ